MKTLAIILVLLIVRLSNSFAQTLDKDYVDNWILKTFPGSGINDNVIYILNGVVIKNDTLNTELGNN